MKKILSYIAIAAILSPTTVFAAYNTILFQPQQIYSGVNATTSSSTAYTATSSDVVGYSTIMMTPTVGSLAITLPASSTLLSWLPQPGLRLEMFLFNATTSPNINLTVVDNTANGSTLETASSSVAKITPLRGAILDVMREANNLTDASTTLGNFLWTLIPAY